MERVELQSSGGLEERWSKGLSNLQQQVTILDEQDSLELTVIVVLCHLEKI